jgi:PilS N terminal
MTTTQATSMFKKNKQRGFSNVQIAIGILVGVIALLGSLSGFQFINQSKVNNEIIALTDLKSSTMRYGQFVPTFTGNVALDTLNEQNFFNASGFTYVGGTTPTLTNQWGGAVTVAAGQLSVAGDAIDFTFANVPASACKELATKVDNITARVKIGAATGTIDRTADTATKIAYAKTNCVGNVSIVYTITK